MKTVIKTISMLLVLACAAPVFALSLQEAKQQGLVGEQPNGYLGVVKNNSSAVSALVKNINTKRKNAYQGIAQKNGTPLDAIEKLAGRKAINKTPKGQYVKNASGSWVKQ